MRGTAGPGWVDPGRREWVRCRSRSRARYATSRRRSISLRTYDEVRFNVTIMTTKTAAAGEGERERVDRELRSGLWEGAAAVRTFECNLTQTIRRHGGGGEECTHYRVFSVLRSLFAVRRPAGRHSPHSLLLKLNSHCTWQLKA